MGNAGSHTKLKHKVSSSDPWRLIDLGRFLDDDYIDEWSARNEILESGPTTAYVPARESSYAFDAKPSQSMVDSMIKEINMLCQSFEVKSMSKKRAAFIKRLLLAYLEPDASSKRSKKTSVSAPKIDYAALLRSVDPALVESGTAGAPTAAEHSISLLPSQQQFAVRFLLQLLKPHDASPSQPLSADSTVLLSQLLSLISSIQPECRDNDLGVFSSVESFLLRSCDQLRQDPKFHELHSRVLLALLDLAISRGRLPALLAVMEKLWHASASADFPLLDSLPALERIQTLCEQEVEKATKVGSKDSDAVNRFVWWGSCHTGSSEPIGSDAKLPYILEFGPDDSKPISFAAFDQHILALDNRGKVFSWGLGTNGQLGYKLTSGQIQKLPMEVTSLAQVKVVQVACGLNFSLVLSDQGQVYSFGQGNNGKLGHGDVLNQSEPKRIEAFEDKKILYVGAGANHSLACTKDTLYTWGNNPKGQLGHNDTVERKVPTVVERMHGIEIIQVVGGYDHSMAVTSGGELWSWGGGYNNKPVTGHGTGLDVKVPTLVKALADHVVVVAACGWDHSMAITSDGSLFTWGDAGNGKLGQSDKLVDVDVPKRVEGFISPVDGSECKIVMANGSEHSTVCLTEEGYVFAFGLGCHLEVTSSGTRLNTAVSKRRPFLVDAVNGLGTCNRVGAGKNFFCALQGPPPAARSGARAANEMMKAQDREEPIAISESSRSLYSVGGALDCVDINPRAKGSSTTDGEQDDSDKKTTGKLSAQDTALVVAAHLERLAHEHLSRYQYDFLAQTAKAKQANANLEPEPRRLVASLAVDARERTLATLFQAIQRLSSEILGDSQPGSAAFDPRKGSVLMSLFRILMANFSQLLLSNIPFEHLGIRVSGPQSSLLSPPAFSIADLHAFLLTVLAKSAPSSFAFQPRNEGDVKDANGAISLSSSAASFSAFLAELHREAVSFLRLGLDTFYPTHADKFKLVCELLGSEKLQSPLLSNALLSRQGLAAEHVVKSFVPQPLQPSNPEDIVADLEAEHLAREKERVAEEEKRREEEEKKRKEEEEKAKEKAASEPWECAVCTYSNEPASSSCAMCSSPRPVPSVAESKEPELKESKAQDEQQKAKESQRREEFLQQANLLSSQQTLEAERALHKDVANLLSLLRNLMHKDVREARSRLTHMNDEMPSLDSLSSPKLVRLGSNPRSESVNGDSADRLLTPLSYTSFLSALLKHTMCWAVNTHLTAAKQASTASLPTPPNSSASASSIGPLSASVAMVNQTAVANVLSQLFTVLLESCLVLTRESVDLLQEPASPVKRHSIFVSPPSPHPSSQAPRPSVEISSVPDLSSSPTSPTSPSFPLSPARLLAVFAILRQSALNTCLSPFFVALDLGLSELASSESSSSANVPFSDMVQHAMSPHCWKQLSQILMNVDQLWQVLHQHASRGSIDSSGGLEVGAAIAGHLKWMTELQRQLCSFASSVFKHELTADVTSAHAIASLPTGPSLPSLPSLPAPQSQGSHASAPTSKELLWLESDLFKVGLEDGPGSVSLMTLWHTTAPFSDHESGEFDSTALDADEEEEESEDEEEEEGKQEEELAGQVLALPAPPATAPRSPQPALARLLLHRHFTPRSKALSVEPLELSRRLTSGSRSAVITSDDARHFCLNLVKGVDTAGNFYNWLCSHMRGTIIGRKNEELDRVARSALAAMLKQHGLLAEAISTARLVSKKEAQQSLARSFHPPRELLLAFQHAQEIRTSCMSLAQKLMSNMDRNEAYVAACAPAQRAAEFLLRLSPSLETVSTKGSDALIAEPNLQEKPVRDQARLESGARKRWKQLKTLLKVIRYFRTLKLHTMIDNFSLSALQRSSYKEIRSFILDASTSGRSPDAQPATSDLSLDRLEYFLSQRTQAALARIRGLRRVRFLLRHLHNPSSRAQFLAAVRHGVQHRHFLEGVGGAGKLALDQLRKQMGGLLFNATQILEANNDSNDSVPASHELKLQALGTWAMKIRALPNDLQMLSDTGIIRVLHDTLASIDLDSQDASSDSFESGVDLVVEPTILRSLCWKVLQLIAVQLGLGVELEIEPSLRSTNYQLQAIFAVLYSEIERLISPPVLPPSSVSNNGAADGVKSALSSSIELISAPVVLRSFHLGYSFDVAALSGSYLEKSKDNSSAPSIPRLAFVPDQFSLSLWMRRRVSSHSSPLRSQLRLVAWSPGVYGRPRLVIGPNDGVLHVVVLCGGPQKSGSVSVTDSETVAQLPAVLAKSVLSSKPIPPNRWVHVLLSYSTSGVALFVDGKLDASKSIDFPLPSDASPSNASTLCRPHPDARLHVGRVRHADYPLMPSDATFHGLSFAGEIGRVTWFSKSLHSLPSGLSSAAPISPASASSSSAAAPTSSLPSDSALSTLLDQGTPQRNPKQEYVSQISALLCILSQGGSAFEEPNLEQGSANLSSVLGTGYLSSPQWLLILRRLLDYTSDESIQIRVLRLFRRALKNVAPQTASKHMWSDMDPTSSLPSDYVVQYFFSLIARSCSFSLAEHPSDSVSTNYLKNKHVAGEAVMLLRYLASLPTATAIPAENEEGDEKTEDKSETEQGQEELSPVAASASKNADAGSVSKVWNEAIVGFIERQLKLLPEVFNSATQHSEQQPQESCPSATGAEKPMWQAQAEMSLATLHVLGGYVEDVRQGGVVRVLPGVNPRTSSRFAGHLASVTSMPHHGEAAYLSALLPAHLHHHQKKSDTEEIAWEAEGYEGQHASQSDQEPCDIQHMCALDELPSTHLLCRHVNTLLPIFQVAIQSQVAVIQALQLVKEEQEDQSIPDSDDKIENPSNPSLFLSFVYCVLSKVLATLCQIPEATSHLLSADLMPSLLFLASMPMIRPLGSSFLPVTISDSALLLQEPSSIQSLERLRVQTAAIIASRTLKAHARDTQDETGDAAKGEHKDVQPQVLSVVVAPTPAPAPAPALDPEAQEREAKVVMLMEVLGVPRSFAVKGLRACLYESDPAAAWILQNTEQLQKEQEQEEAAATKAAVSAPSVPAESKSLSYTDHLIDAIQGFSSPQPEPQLALQSDNAEAEPTAAAPYDIDYFPEYNHRNLPSKYFTVKTRSAAMIREGGEWPASQLAQSLTLPSLLQRLHAINHSLSVLYAREAAIAILGRWSQTGDEEHNLSSFPMSSLGASADLLRLFKLLLFRKSFAIPAPPIEQIPSRELLLPPTLSAQSVRHHHQTLQEIVKRLLIRDADHALGTLLLEDSLKQLRCATKPEYAKTQWGFRDLADDLSTAESKSSEAPASPILAMEYYSLKRPRVELAEWSLHTLLSLEQRHRPADSVSLKTFSRLVSCLATSNLTLRETAIRVLTKILHRLRLMRPAPASPIPPSSKLSPLLLSKVRKAGPSSRRPSDAKGSQPSSPAQQLISISRRGSLTGFEAEELKLQLLRSNDVINIAPPVESVQLSPVPGRRQWTPKLRLEKMRMSGRRGSTVLPHDPTLSLESFLGSMPEDQLLRFCESRLEKEYSLRVLSSRYMSSLLDLMAAITLAKERTLPAVGCIDVNGILIKDTKEIMSHEPKTCLPCPLFDAPSGPSSLSSLYVSWSSCRNIGIGNVDDVEFIVEMAKVSPPSSASADQSASLSPNDTKFEQVYRGPYLATQVSLEPGLASFRYQFRVKAILTSPSSSSSVGSRVPEKKEVPQLLDQERSVSAEASTVVSNQSQAKSIVFDSDWSPLLQVERNYPAPLAFPATREQLGDASSLIAVSSSDPTVLISNGDGTTLSWGTALAGSGFTSGVHTWLVKVDVLRSPNIFMGVARTEASRKNYCGFDEFGWAIYGHSGTRYTKKKCLDTANWHVHTAKPGDIYCFVLDCDRGTLQYYVNGEDFGVAFHSLPRGVPLFPAVSLNLSRDQATIVALPSYTSARFSISESDAFRTPVLSTSSLRKDEAEVSTVPQGSDVATSSGNEKEESVKSPMARSVFDEVEKQLEAAKRRVWQQYQKQQQKREQFPLSSFVVEEYAGALSMTEAITKGRSPSLKELEKAYTRWAYFTENTIRTIRKSDGVDLMIQTDSEQCLSLGFRVGAIVSTPKGRGVVLGCSIPTASSSAAQLWVRVDGTPEPLLFQSSQLSAFDLSTESKAETSDQAPPASAQASEPVPSSSSSSSTPSGSSEGNVSPSTTRVTAPSPAPKWSLSQFVHELEDRFWFARDADIVRLTNQLSWELSCPPEDLLFTDFAAGLAANQQQMMSLRDIPPLVLAARFCLLLHYNLCVSRVLPFVDHPSVCGASGLGSETGLDVLEDAMLESVVDAGALSASGAGAINTSSRSSLGYQLSSCRELLMTPFKNSLWTTLQYCTSSTVSLMVDPFDIPKEIKTVEINRHQRAKALEKGSNRSKMAYSMFGQLRKALSVLDARELRYAWLRPTVPGLNPETQRRCFYVKFKGEGVSDEGGPFREIFNDVIAELESSNLPLFIRVPNYHSAVGGNRESWLPNPGCDKLDLFYFLGQLIGIALRCEIQLSLNLAPIVWKKLVGLPVHVGDLEAVDKTTVDFLFRMERMMVEKKIHPSDDSQLSEGFLEELFEQEFQVNKFVCTLSDGSQAELLPGGAQKPLTNANRSQWITLVVYKRLHEADAQISALRSGLASVVPLDILSVMTPEELEQCICGRPDFKVDVLRSIVVYEGKVKEEDPHIRYFWETMNELNPSQKSQFLRFVWARSRLPALSPDVKFTIMEPDPKDIAQPDLRMPHSSTCFFKLRIPPYTNKEVLKKRLLFAIYHCGTMDADHVVASSEVYNYEAEDIEDIDR